MTRPSPAPSIPLRVAAAAFLLSVGAADARAGHGASATRMVYTTPANILRGQQALESLGLLERAHYAPGMVDEATRQALMTYQRRHFIRASGLLDWETFAMLPVDARPDKDDDGVRDEDDRCVGTTAGARVGHDGCPIKGS